MPSCFTIFLIGPKSFLPVIFIILVHSLRTEINICIENVNELEVCEKEKITVRVGDKASCFAKFDHKLILFSRFLYYERKKYLIYQVVIKYSTLQQFHCDIISSPSLSLSTDSLFEASY